MPKEAIATVMMAAIVFDLALILESLSVFHFSFGFLGTCLITPLLGALPKTYETSREKRGVNNLVESWRCKRHFWKKFNTT